MMFTCSMCKIQTLQIYPTNQYQICKRCDTWINSTMVCYPCIVDERIKHENEEHASVELV